MSDSSTIYIDAKTPESAVLETKETLLPRKVYQELKSLIQESLNNIPDNNNSNDVNNLRAHNAISVDGSRGTGKTSVLVNLKTFLEEDPDNLLKDVHILDPVDPTQLEDHESLFLHVIVASIISDNEIREKQQSNPDKRKHLNQTLERLGTALESIESQKEERGMDKIRALLGNKHLANCVHEFFKAAAQLLNKKLLILPIDDVDTSLNRAFENLEVIRKYLITPYVLPIVSGDRNLYHEVTWRDFHGRFTSDSKHNTNEAYESSLDLAHEYQRKVLPLPRRLSMPAVSDYINNPNIKIKAGDNKEKAVPVRNFYAWLEIFIGGPVNGLKNSHLPVPIPSIRALTQLINKCSSLITELPDSVLKAESPLQVKSAVQTPSLSYNTISDILQGVISGDELNRTLQSVEEGLINSNNFKLEPELNEKISNWGEALLDYFAYEHKAGEAYLVLLARKHWINADQSQTKSILDTPLFQPLIHSSPEYKVFDSKYDLSEWKESLKDNFKNKWLEDVGSLKTIVHYPRANTGIEISNRRDFQKEINNITPFPGQDFPDFHSKANLLVNLFVQSRFSDASGRSSKTLNIGRFFEIIITSLVSPVTVEKLRDIISTPPFYSASSLAPDKEVLVTFKEESATPDPLNELDEAENQEDTAIELLVNEINGWRNNHALDNVHFSPWLIYQVFKQVFSSPPKMQRGVGGEIRTYHALSYCNLTFYSIWAAFGSFEKGRIFGLNEIIATTNLESPHNFENNAQFKLNLAPFSSGLKDSSNADEIANQTTFQLRKQYAKATQTVSYFLFDHPLRKWAEKALLNTPPPPAFSKGPHPKNQRAKEALCRKINITDIPGTLQQSAIIKAIKNMRPDEILSIERSIAQNYPKTSPLRTLRKAMKQLNIGEQ